MSATDKNLQHVDTDSPDDAVIDGPTFVIDRATGQVREKSPIYGTTEAWVAVDVHDLDGHVGDGGGPLDAGDGGGGD